MQQNHNQTADPNANAQAFIDMMDDLASWIILAPHTQPSRIMHLPEGVHDLTENQMKRMTDEYNMVEAIVQILDETKTELQGLGLSPLRYEQELILRFNTLMHPQSEKIAQAVYDHWRYQITDGNARLNMAKAKTILEMFQKIAFIRTSYAHLFYAPKSESR